MYGLNRRLRACTYYRAIVSPSAATTSPSSSVVSTMAILFCFVSARSGVVSLGKITGDVSFFGTGDGGEVDIGDAYCELEEESGGEGLAEDTDANGDSHLESVLCDSLYVGGGEREV